MIERLVALQHPQTVCTLSVRPTRRPMSCRKSLNADSGKIFEVQRGADYYPKAQRLNRSWESSQPLRRRRLS